MTKYSTYFICIFYNASQRNRLDKEHRTIGNEKCVELHTLGMSPQWLNLYNHPPQGEF